VQHNTELLVVTIIYTEAKADADVQVHIRTMIQRMHNAPELTTLRTYRSRSADLYYIMLTTWKDVASWQHARDHYDPQQLFQPIAHLLTSAPQQWYLAYTWGYTRPAAAPTIASVHLTHVAPHYLPLVQKGWLQGIHHYPLQFSLAFAFMAQEQMKTQSTPDHIASIQNNEQRDEERKQKLLHFSFFSWAGESERAAFYATPNYQMVTKFIKGMGTIRTLSLELF